MIKSIQPLSMPEVKGILAKSESEKIKEIIIFLKKFTKLEEKEAKKLREEINNLGILKIKNHHIAKIIDIIPVDSEDVNKIFTDVSLDQNEITQILEVVKKYL